MPGIWILDRSSVDSGAVDDHLTQTQKSGTKRCLQNYSLIGHRLDGP